MAATTIQLKTNREAVKLVLVMHTFKDSTLTQSLTTPGDTINAGHQCWPADRNVVTKTLNPFGNWVFGFSEIRAMRVCDA